MNISSVRQDNLCIQCGMCTAVCPLRCIVMRRERNNFLPHIDSEKCINCGICHKVCSVSALSEYDGKTPLDDFIVGKHIDIYRAKTNDVTLLHNATSGGVATTLIKRLLDSKQYDCAFVVDGYSYDAQLKTVRIDATTDLSQTQKSRYLTVSHCDAVKYIKENPTQRVILIGTGCIITSFLNVIKLYNLDRRNYLLLGLFCDKTMNYGVYEYFKQHKVNKGKTIKRLFFRSKDVAGWPGGVKLEYNDGTSSALDRAERMKLKDYFVPEKCLYCLNKLNANADIALGDNYIVDNHDADGISSVIIRTEIGQSVWNQHSAAFVFARDCVEKLKQSQWLSLKTKNLSFAGIKGLLQVKVTRECRNHYRKALKKIKVGNSTDVYNMINKDLRRVSLSKRILQGVFRINSEYQNGKKLRVLTVLWLKIKIQ